MLHDILRRREGESDRRAPFAALCALTTTAGRGLNVDGFVFPRTSDALRALQLLFFRNENDVDCVNVPLYRSL
jgi:hypothetical protein